MNQRPSALDLLINQCRSTYSYPSTHNVSIEFLFRQIYQEIQNCFPTPEVNTKSYNEQSGRQFKVIFIRFQVLVPYKGNAYNVLSQVIFPPYFPSVPPIFSVINSDDNRFQVNKFYLNFLLPDGTYEAKLRSAAYWAQNAQSFTTMFAEFCQTTSSFFPFFATNTPLKNNNFPLFFNPLYNDPYSQKPFDYPQTNGPIIVNPVQSNQPLFAQMINPELMKNIPAQFTQPAQFGPSPIFDALTGDYISTNRHTSNGSNQSQNSGRPSAQTLKEAVLKLKTEIDIDSKTIYEDIDFLLKKKEELMQHELEIAQKRVLLEQQISEAKTSEEELLTSVEKAKSGRPNRIENQIEFFAPRDEYIIKLVAELKGVQETEIFVENVFMESASAELDSFLMKMNSLWRKEFDKSLALKFI